MKPRDASASKGDDQKGTSDSPLSQAECQRKRGNSTPSSLRNAGGTMTFGQLKRNVVIARGSATAKAASPRDSIRLGTIPPVARPRTPAVTGSRARRRPRHQESPHIQYGGILPDQWSLGAFHLRISPMSTMRAKSQIAMKRAFSTATTTIGQDEASPKL